MTRLAEFLAVHGPMLLVGATALLSAGTIALLLQRSPIHRQRIAEMTLLCVLLWVALACVPMRRWSPRPAVPQRYRAESSVVINPSPQAASDLPANWQSVLASLTRPPKSTPQRLANHLSPDVNTARAASSHSSGPSEKSLGWRYGAGSAFVWAYMGGASACAAWLLLGHVLLWRVTRRAHAPQTWLAELFRGTCEAVGVRKARVLVVTVPLRPVSCGLLRPTVLLGADDCSGANRLRLRQVLLHEAAHLRQRDAWGNALFNLAMPLLYFHPLYWVLRSKASLAREMVADDIAASSTSRAAYAADLLELARLRSGYRPAPLAAVAIFRSPSHFYRRMHMLMQRNIRLESRCSPAWKLASGVACAGVLFAATATLGLRRAAAQETPKPIEINQEKLDRDLLNAKLALNKATAERDAFVSQAKAGLMPAELKLQGEADDQLNDQLKVELRVARDQFGDNSRRVRELATRLQAYEDLRKERIASPKDQALAAQQAELDSRIAVAQKNLEEVETAQQSVRAAADDDDSNQPSEREDRAIRKRAELQAIQARDQAAKAEQDAEAAQGSAAETDKVRQMLKAQLKQSEAEMAQLRAQLEQVQAQMKVAAAQAQHEVDRANKMLKEQADKVDRNFKDGADQFRDKIDRIILDKLKSGGLPSKGGELEEMVRRTYLDVLGRLPNPDERDATAKTLKKYLQKYPSEFKQSSPDPNESKKNNDGAQLNAAVGGLRPQLDLVALANSYADARGSIAAAQEAINSAEMNPRERAAAKAKLVAAEQKAHLLRSITEAALQQAKQEYDLARRRFESGVASPNDAVEAEGRVRILSLILQSSPDGKSSDLQRQ